MARLDQLIAIIVADADDAEVRVQRGERIVGDLRLGRRDRRDQAGLARRGEADEGDVCDDLQFEEDVAFPAGGTEQRESGRLALGRCQSRVAETALSARGDHEPHARLVQVDELVAVGILHHGSHRNQEHEFWPIAAVAVVPHARAPLVGLAVRSTVEAQERRGLRVAHEDDISAVAAVAAVGTGKRLELLALYRNTTVTAVSGVEVKSYLVYEGSHGAYLLIVCLKGESEPKPARTLTIDGRKPTERKNLLHNKTYCAVKPTGLRRC